MSTTTLNGPTSHVDVGKVAHGLMMMTWTPSPVSDEQAFEAIKTSIDSAPKGTKMMLNSGEFYGLEPREANLELVSRFFEKYPDYADRAFLSVKGGVDRKTPVPNASPENLRASVDTILEKLRGKKKLDLFECARVDKNYPTEDTIAVLAGLVKEGKFDYIGMSECSAATLRKAHAIHPITAVEIEVSPWSYEEETKNVIATAKELGIAVVGYSPLGRGFLTGTIKKPEDVTAINSGTPRFEAEAMKHNLALVDALKAIAEKKNVTPAQLCIAWVSGLGPHVIPLPGSSHAKRTAENLAAAQVNLTAAEMEEIGKVIEGHETMGDRYAPHVHAYSWG